MVLYVEPLGLQLDHKRADPGFDSEIYEAQVLAGSPFGV